jgi:hypothetical protein
VGVSAYAARKAIREGNAAKFLIGNETCSLCAVLSCVIASAEVLRGLAYAKSEKH